MVGQAQSDLQLPVPLTTDAVGNSAFFAALTDSSHPHTLKGPSYCSPNLLRPPHILFLFCSAFVYTFFTILCDHGRRQPLVVVMVVTFCQ